MSPLNVTRNGSPIFRCYPATAVSAMMPLSSGEIQRHCHCVQ